MVSDEKLNIDLSALDGLSEEEKKVALEILQQYAAEGESSLFHELTDIDFDEIPVDIDTFLHDRRYLGNGLYDAEGRFTLFPYWEKCLHDIFPDNLTTKYNNIVLTGAIGLGKTLVADIILLYMLYRLLCLKDPYTYYGMQVIDKISISFMNVTIDNAKGVALDKFNQLILASEWFLAHGEMAGTAHLIYRPEKHIELIAASSNNQIVGRALFCLDGNTIIETDSGAYKISDLVNKNFKVYTLSNNNKIELSNLCTAKPTIKTNEEYQIELENGSIVKCTKNHKFLLKNGTYKEAQFLTEDDELEEIDLTGSIGVINQRDNVPSTQAVK